MGIWQGGVGGGGAGVKLRVPPDIFTGANRSAAETARNNGLDAAALAEFDDDPNLLIILRIGGVDTFQGRRTGQWRDIANIAEGEPGPPPSDAQVQAAVQSGVKQYARAGGRDIQNDDLDDDTITDAKFTAEVREKISEGSAPDVVVASANTSIPATARGDTYVNLGSSGITYTLPQASGSQAVANGFELVVSNQGSGDLTIDGHGADTIDGEATLVLSDRGRAVRLQKISNGRWITTADTKDEAGGGGGGSETPAFEPTKQNLYDAVKEIFEHNPSVTPDDENDELDFSPGAAGAIGDDTILPIKARSSTGAFKKEWRAQFASASIGLVANALPAVANHNTGDLIVIGRGGATAVPFREVDAPADELNATVAGDVMMLLAAGWSRIGNLFSGGIAAAAARAIAEANRDRLMVELTQGDFYGGSAAAIRGTYHINVQSMPGAFPTANIVQIWVGDPGISRVLAQAWDPAETQRILQFEIDATISDNLQANDLLTLGTELGIEIRLIAPGSVEVYRGGFDFPLIEEPSSVAFDIRSHASQIATPASGDRFFFTDENQSGDPLRYTQMATLATAIMRRSFFETAVGASASAGNVPAGAYELVGYCTKPKQNTRTRRYPFNIALADIPAGSSVNINVSTRNPNGPDDDVQDISLALQYVPATRTLTYAIVPASGAQNARDGGVPVLSAIRARGFA